jgi:leucyl-tRNA synthetase
MVEWKTIQEKWQKKWQDAELGKAQVSDQPKFFMIFAYPGISGFLHVGHMRGFSYTDAICRYERMQGKQVLFPVGTHASGNQALGFANKIKNNDETWISYLKNNGCDEKTIKTLVNPEKVVAYFNQVYIHDYWKKFGFLCDWERFTCTIWKDYEKFIQWQFKKLMQNDLLIQKPYYATACIVHGPVAVDPSETDISKGGTAEKNEYTLLKFKLDDEYLVAATLRPETIYGQTNLWVNPEAYYVRLEVEGEEWIMSKEAAEKLKYQKDEVLLKGDVDITNYIGKSVLAPGINREVPVLPATFCNPKVGSGIVTSVPSDAPYDYVALEMLKCDTETLEKYNLQNLQTISLIPIIKSKEYGNYPAQEIVEKMGITSLNDPKLEEATQKVYKAGFHTGILMQTCGEYSGKRVSEAKELMKAKLLEEGKADVFHDLSEEVICRCGEQVVIRRVDDQWFITYSDQELTQKSKEQVRHMRIFPQEYKKNMPATLDWFSDRACARLGNWLGSTLPFDKKWIVEPISDSTLYPAYYIVSKYVNSKKLKTEELTEDFFDYVFLGKGEGKSSWKVVKNEFDYFYPLDLNLGGKEHQTVHFPVFLMNHVGILPQEKWPQGILVNWWVTGKGSKISKSKGGAEPIPAAIEKYGVDAMRLYYAHIGSPHVDVVWDETVVLNYKNALERIHAVITSFSNLDKGKQTLDTWLLARLHRYIEQLKHSMQNYELRELASVVYFSIFDDVKWYLRREGGNKETLAEVLDLWCKLMCPITPHLAEEVFPGKELVSSSSWPKFDEKKINPAAEASEELVKTAMEGMRNVFRLAKLEQPKKCTLFVAEPWLYVLFTLLGRELAVTRNIGEIMKKVLEIDVLRMKGKEAGKCITSILKDPSKLPQFVATQEDELKVLEEACTFLEKEFSCTLDIVAADKSVHQKRNSALPGRVGILVE